MTTTMSDFPSPSISARLSSVGVVPTVKSTFAANEPALIVPAVLVFRKTDNVVPPALDTVISVFPSPSTSPDVRIRGVEPEVKSTFAANEMVPGKLVFLKTETVDAP